MNIPGANRRGRLGQGIPGGAASLPGSLPLPGGGTLGPPPGSLPAPVTPRRPIPAVAGGDAQRPVPTWIDNSDAQSALKETGGSLQALQDRSNRIPNPGSTKNITVALGVLDQVRKGKLKPEKAAKLMQGLTAGDQEKLATLVSIRNTRTGKINTTEIKALQELQKLPAPTDQEPHDLLSNFARDTSNLITGLPAGIGLAAAYGSRDILNATIPGRKKTSLFKDKILKPVGHQYAETYGPLVHGDVGGFLHQLHEHPVGPILDVASIFSAGVGTAGRLGRAGEAIGEAGTANVARQVINPLTGTPATQFSKVPVALSRLDKARVGATAFVKGGPKGSLIDWYEERRGINHEAEIRNTMKEVMDVLDDPNLRLDRRGLGEVVRDVASDIRATGARDIAHPGELAANLPQFLSSPVVGHSLTAAGVAAREASDLIRAGAIYMRPAYLPNNWAGNSFMTLTHQGVFAPVNLAKSLVLDKHIGARYTRAMDKSMGANPATLVTSGKGRGYVSALTQPFAHVMGALADQPFRRAAWLQEARRAGYSKLSDVKKLFDNAAVGDEKALHQIADIARKAQEEIVKFGHMNEDERAVIRNLVFVYSWMRGAGRYASRFPMQHPIQTNVFNRLSEPGNEYTQSIMGGVPSFMAGVVPIGRGKDGNPIVVNPFSLNPLGTGLQLMRAAAGTLDVLRDPKSFNKYSQEDVVGLLNPLLGAYISARDGGPSMKKQVENTIAAMALVKGLRHPGSGSIYPTSRSEAVGHFTLGSLYPREADQAAVTKSLERENANNPIALIPQQVMDFEKATGREVPYNLVIAYRKDLEDLAFQKEFQSHYADSHGASGFRNMPASNRLEAGLEFLRKYGKIKPETVDQIEAATKDLKSDAVYNDYANAIWNLTGVGQWKSAWDEMMRELVKGPQLTRKRP